MCIRDSATTGLGHSNIDGSEKNIYNALNGSKTVSEIIQNTQIDNLDIITSNVDLSGLEVETADDNGRAFILRDKLSLFFKENMSNYSHVFIDCPPSLGLITINALTSSDSVIIPIQCEYYALEGLGKLLNTIKGVQKVHNEKLEIEGILLTMFDSRLRLSNQVKNDVKKHFGNMVFSTIIPRNVSLGEAPSYGESIIVYNSTSKGSKSYIKFAQEVINLN